MNHSDNRIQFVDNSNFLRKLHRDIQSIIISSGSKGGRTRRAPPLIFGRKNFFFKYLLFAKQDSDLLRIQSTFERR